MDALKEWVKGLVLLALLAGCLELTLPMGNMKRYVKLIMGLLIVLATLRPVFGFLGQPVAVTAPLFEEKAGLPSLGEIMARAQAFRAKNEALAAGEVKIGLAGEAARAARSVAGVADAEAEVELSDGKERVEIRSVTVRVTPGAAGGVRPVAPVDPVAPAGRPVGGSAGSGAGTARPLTEAEQKLSAAVRAAVAERLGLEGDAARVRVVIAEAQGR